MLCSHMSGAKRRVRFQAPDRLTDRTDALATVPGEDRTELPVRALQKHLREVGPR